MKKTLLWGAIVLGAAFVAVAIFYWITPAGSLPTFMPGFEAGVPTVHVKHGLAALILAILLFVYAWFTSGSQPSTKSASSPAPMQ